MRILVIGATGYIGGSVAARLLQAGHAVSGLVRDAAKAAALEARGIASVRGTLDDAATLAEACRAADAVINAASSDHRGAVEACLGALAGTGKLFLHTSGTSIVAADTAGELDPTIHDEATPFTPHPLRAARVALDAKIRAAAEMGVRSVVLCNSLIYGQGLGLHKDSVQVPSLIELARQRGMPCHVGPGRNVWSNVHIEDVAELYLLALERAPAGSFYFVESGEASFCEMAAAIGRMLGLGERTQEIPLVEAIALWGEGKARLTMASSCRVRAERARTELGWSPQKNSVVEEIERGWYARQAGRA
jgi:nucleoside-diphosphate-sugar epimerase